MTEFMLLHYLEILSFERPYFLAFAFQPLVLIFFRRIKMHSLAKYSEMHLWPWSINISKQHFRSRKSLRFIAWLLIAIALSGPRLPALSDSLSKHNKNIKSDISIIIIADINGITKSEYNFYLIRLTDFIDKLNGEKVGLIALSTSSALVSPLTNDYSASSFYLRQFFDVISYKPGLTTNDLFNSFQMAHREIKNSKPSTGVIIYWSDYLRNKLTSTQQFKLKLLLEKINKQNIKVYPVWNDSIEIKIDSSDIYEVFGDLANETSGVMLQDLYNTNLEDIKSLAIYDTSKKYSFQHLYSYPLIFGLLILIISFNPFQIFNRVEYER